jgi:16S rRNA (cytidine1402-2'-O)-methyltransferase
MTAKGRLTLVGLPIGHPDDIGRRAVQVLQAADVILCGNRKEARRQLDRFDLSAEFVEIDTRNMNEESENFLMALLQGKHIVLVAENGMPVISDFGLDFLQAAIDARMDVDVVPGPSAATAAVALSGFDAKRFLFYGYLSPNRQERRSELKRLRYFDATMVFYDAAHRLPTLLGDLETVLGGRRRACVACDLTLPSVQVRRGTLSQLLRHFSVQNKKRLFTVVVEGAEEKDDSGRGKKGRR